MADDFFEQMPNLKFLALQDNQIEEWFDLRSLKSLEFLDLRNNKLPSDGAANLPPQLIVLKLQGNPLCGENGKFGYRKDFVSSLTELTELDKIEVQVAERLHY